MYKKEYHVSIRRPFAKESSTILLPRKAVTMLVLQHHHHHSILKMKAKEEACVLQVTTMKFLNV